MSILWSDPSSSLFTSTSRYELESLFTPLLRLAKRSLHVASICVRLYEDDAIYVLTDERVRAMQGHPLNTVTKRVCEQLDKQQVTQIIEPDYAASGDYHTDDVEIVQSLMAITLQLPTEEHIGVLFVTEETPRDWQTDDIETFEEIAGLVRQTLDMHLNLSYRKHKEIELNANLQMLGHMADSLTDAILMIDGETQVIYCNQAVFNIFGYRPQDLLGQPIDILTQSSFQSNTGDFVMGAMTDSEPVSSWNGLRMIGQHRDGHSIPIEIALDIILDSDEPYFKLVIRDVSQQVDFEHQLQADTTRYLQILDALPDMVYVKDSGSRLVWANKAFRDFFNMPLVDLIGRIKIDGAGSLDMQDSLSQDEEVFSRGIERYSVEEFIVRHDGLKREFMTTKTPIFDSNNEVTLLVGISTDITETKNVERYLTEALQQREELVELKTNFVSMVSHEFRTPLSVILSSVDIIRAYYERLTEEKRNEKLATIIEQVHRLTRLMDEILIINKGDAQGLPFAPVPTDVMTLASSIIEEVRIAQQKYDIEVESDFIGQREKVEIDPDLFRHILQNLVSNAIKYSRPQSKISVKISMIAHQITIAVADTGIGIPKENQETLFQTFHRADNVGTIQGTGLGLAIVKRAVDTHGGTINFRSVENQGTLFVVTLPVAGNESE